MISDQDLDQAAGYVGKVLMHLTDPKRTAKKRGRKPNQSRGMILCARCSTPLRDHPLTGPCPLRQGG